MVDRLLRYLSFFALITYLGSCSPSKKEEASHLPEEALSTFRLPPGFKIEQIAAEPLISDPVDMCIDEEGRMFVVEMHGYPLNLKNTGKIILLADEDGDGRMDKRTVFEDDLILPTGIMRYKDGVIVTDAPYVYYLADTDGDGKADLRDTLLTGFALTNPQYLVNKPTYGLDNWIYLAHERFSDTETFQDLFGDEGKDVFFLHQPNGPKLGINANGKIVRFTPDLTRLENTSSYTQFGLAFDRWGHHFNVENDRHIFQEVIEQKYVTRNPESVIGSAVASISDHGDACKVYPVTRNPEHQLLTDVGIMTSACGIILYEGGAFPKGYNENLSFVCEPVSNLIHADTLKENGASFTASRKLPHSAFLASTDPWFRPVNQYIGPDGALYVVDYYREIIEHPEWMSEEAIKSGRLYNGSNMGRIYRITKTEAPKPDWSNKLNLNKLSEAALAEKLGDANSWWRLNAQRLLVARGDTSVAQSLRHILMKTSGSLARLHALWTLEGLRKLTPDDIETGLKDSSAGVRENAIKLAELHLKEYPHLESALLHLVTDPDPRVRFQLLCTLGDLKTPTAAEARDRLLFNDLSNQWMQIAALSATSVESSRLLSKIISKYDPKNPAFNEIIEKLGNSIGAKESTPALLSILNSALEKSHPWQRALMSGIAKGMSGREQFPEGMVSLRTFLREKIFSNKDLRIRKDIRNILKKIGFGTPEEGKRLAAKANELAKDTALPSGERAEALRLLTAIRPQKQLYLDLLASADATEIRLAAIEGLDQIPDTTIAHYVLSNWTGLTPQLKDAALNTFISEPFNIPRINLLLKALKRGQPDKSELGWGRSVILMRDIPDSLKEQFRTLLANQNGDRDAIIRNYKTALTLKGNIRNGESIYEANCIICHQFHGKMGIDFGPDLGTIREWSPESILINILDPNKAIAHGYELYSVQKENGAILEGIMLSETDNAITLKTQNGVENVLPKKEIKSKIQLGISPMPADFENKIDPQQMADLIAFLKKGN